MDSIRKDFPSLSRKVNNKACIFLDGPAGTQVPDYVIDAMAHYYHNSNANKHGAFTTAQETDVMMSATRSTIATFLGAEGGHNISLGQNMTTLNYSLARAIGRHLQPGDEILITQLDHEANRGPWLSLRSEGIIVKEVKMLKNGRLDYEDFEEKINEDTRLVCMGWSSNIAGTVNNVKLARKLTHKVGAWLLIDAVHYAPHYKIDVTAMGFDFLLCSAYKFYGPHVGILYSKTGFLDQLPTDRLRTAAQHAPYSIETGTLNHAAMAGVKASIEYIAQLGKGDYLHDRLEDAMTKIGKHEGRLAELLYDGLKDIDDVKIIGPSFAKGQRAPTISFVHKRHRASVVCKALAKHNIFAWSGHFYAIRATEVLGLQESGGVTRLGISAYIKDDEIKKTLKVIKSL